MLEELAQLDPSASTKGSLVAVDNGYGRIVCSSKFPQRKTRGLVTKKFLGYIVLLFLWPEATEVGLAAKGGSYKAHCPFPKSHPHPLLLPPAIPAFLSFLLRTNAAEGAFESSLSWVQPQLQTLGMSPWAWLHQTFLYT